MMMMMRRTPLLILLSLLFSYSYGATPKETQFAKLVTASQKTNILSITPETFDSIFPDPSKQTQNFSLAILFTLQDAQQCPYCPIVSEIFVKAAETYQKTLGYAGYESATFLNNPIFFAVCDYQRCMPIMKNLGIDSLPRIGIIVPSSKLKLQRGQPQRPYGIQFMDLNKENDIAAFVSKKTGHSMEVPLSTLELATAVLSLAFLVILFVFMVLPKLSKIYKQPMFWFALSLAVYAFVMSGGVYNSIHHPGWYYKAPNGAITLIYPSPRQQFIVEGLLMSATLTGLGIITISLTQYIPQAKDPWQQRILFAMIATAWVVCYRFLFSVFRMKNRHYPY